MPILASLLSSLFAGLAGFFSAWMTKKAAFGAAAIATFGLLVAGLFAVISVLFAGLIVSFPFIGPLGMSIVWIVLPDNAATCIAVVISTDTAVALYRWNVGNLRLLASV